jgi:hypothetical protein
MYIHIYIYIYVHMYICIYIDFPAMPSSSKNLSCIPFSPLDTSSTTDGSIALKKSSIQENGLQNSVEADVDSDKKTISDGLITKNGVHIQPNSITAMGSEEEGVVITPGKDHWQSQFHANASTSSNNTQSRPQAREEQVIFVE